ncbi:guanine nucleotide binding protein, alpha subunit, partial [Crepidotus variabilis]
RNAWMPFLEDLNAIIFPVASFDEHLEEDDNLNYLQDSMILWSSICSSRFFLRASLILILLCQCDILETKLDSGVRFRNYVTSYGDRLNRSIEVLQCISFLSSSLQFEFW